MEHELNLKGPARYFSTPYVWFGECSCGTYSIGKTTSEKDARDRHAQHVKDKRALESSNQ